MKLMKQDGTDTDPSSTVSRAGHDKKESLIKDPHDYDSNFLVVLKRRSKFNHEKFLNVKTNQVQDSCHSGVHFSSDDPGLHQISKTVMISNNNTNTTANNNTRSTRSITDQSSISHTIKSNTSPDSKARRRYTMNKHDGCEDLEHEAAALLEKQSYSDKCPSTESAAGNNNNQDVIAALLQDVKVNSQYNNNAATDVSGSITASDYDKEEYCSPNNFKNPEHDGTLKNEFHQYDEEIERKTNGMSTVNTNSITKLDGHLQEEESLEAFREAKKRCLSRNSSSTTSSKRSFVDPKREQQPTGTSSLDFFEAAKKAIEYSSRNLDAATTSGGSYTSNCTDQGRVSKSEDTFFVHEDKEVEHGNDVVHVSSLPNNCDEFLEQHRGIHKTNSSRCSSKGSTISTFAPAGAIFDQGCDDDLSRNNYPVDSLRLISSTSPPINATKGFDRKGHRDNYRQNRGEYYNMYSSSDCQYHLPTNAYGHHNGGIFSDNNSYYHQTQQDISYSLYQYPDSSKNYLSHSDHNANNNTSVLSTQNYGQHCSISPSRQHQTHNTNHGVPDALYDNNSMHSLPSRQIMQKSENTYYHSYSNPPPPQFTQSHHAGFHQANVFDSQHRHYSYYDAEERRRAPLVGKDIELKPMPPLNSHLPSSSSGRNTYSRLLPSASSSAPQLLPYHQREVLPLSTSDDENWLSEFLCFVRSDCVEVFKASQEDVSARMNSKKVLIGQVGIRCRFCAHLPHRERTGRSSSFPSSLSRIYQSLTMMLRDHFTKCSAMPPQLNERYLTLKANASQGATDSKRYWIDSAHILGLCDTEGAGIRFRNDNI